MNIIARPLVLLLVSALACSNGPIDDNPSSTTGYLHGYVQAHTDSLAMPGVSVSLIEPVPYRVIAGPVFSDATGHYAFNAIPAGNWYLFVIKGNYFMFDATASRVAIEPGDSLRHDVSMIQSELWDDKGAHFGGTVRDAGTGAPIAGAFVSAMMFGVGNSFEGVPISEAITDSLGHYLIEATSWVITATGPFHVTHPFGVTKEGYAPYFVGDVPIADASIDTVYTMDVTLKPEASYGSIRGRVRYLSQDLQGIPVGLDYSTAPVDSIFGDAAKTAGDAQPTSMLGKAVRTDSHGRFSIGRLAAGTYFVDAAFLPDDGFTMALNVDQERRIFVDLREGQSLDIGTIQLAKAIRPLSPLPGATISGRNLRLRWTPVPGADHYRVSAGVGHFLTFSETVTGTTYQFEETLPSGLQLRWYVSGVRGTSTSGFETIGSFEAVSTFTVGP